MTVISPNFELTTILKLLPDAYIMYLSKKVQFFFKAQ